MAGILLAVDTLESIGTTGNATTSQILTAVSSILTQAQATTANTDQLEALLTSLQATLQAESDQTQLGLSDIKNAVDNTPVVLELVDYVAAVTTTQSYSALSIDSVVFDQRLSGAGQLWNDAFPHPPENVFNALDSATSWKWYGNLSTESGKRYRVTVNLDTPQETIKVFFGSEVRVVSSSQEFFFIGDGSFAEAGLIFEPNTQAGTVIKFFVELSEKVQVSAGSCKEFVRMIKNGVASDYKADGLTPYTVTGVVQRECPVSFFEGTETIERTFTGYKSFSFAVVEGTVIVNDGVLSSYYPKTGGNGSALGKEFNGNTFTQSNTITITPVGAATYTWAGVK